jgi:biopolymer transport protein ExbB
LIIMMSYLVMLARTTQPAPATEMTFLQLLIKGGIFMIPIGLCSLAAVALILERMIALRRKVIIPPGFLDGLAKVGLSNRQAAMEYCRNSKAPVGRVIAVGIRKLPQGEEAVEQAIEDAGANEVSKLRKNLRALYSIATISPLLGLLGTVWGMIQSFQVASARGLGKAELLAGGIYEALVTTLAGLMVAIPVLVFYYHFLGRIDRIVAEMNDVSERFLEEQVSPVATSKKTVVPATTEESAPAIGIPATA